MKAAARLRIAVVLDQELVNRAPTAADDRLQQLDPTVLESADLHGRLGDDDFVGFVLRNDAEGQGGGSGRGRGELWGPQRDPDLFRRATEQRHGRRIRTRPT